MVTNQIMTRKMGAFDILQRTKDGFFNATMLIKQWNNQSATERKMDNYFAKADTDTFIQTIMRRENLHTPKLVYVKSKASRGDSAGTWMHPLLFIDFAMWINPEFKYDVLKFVYDQMIKFRNDAGDAYRELSSAIASISSKVDMPARMQKLAEAINYVVFAEHYPNIRNDHGSETEMQDLLNMEKKLADLVNDGFIINFDDLIEYLRKQWLKRRTPKCLK